jgi:hypothetical protein
MAGVVVYACNYCYLGGIGRSQKLAPDKNKRPLPSPKISQELFLTLEM